MKFFQAKFPLLSNILAFAALAGLVYWGVAYNQSRGYIDRVSAQVAGKTLVFKDNNKSATAEISISAKIGGVETNVDDYLTPYFNKDTRQVKFGFKMGVPEGETGQTLAAKMEAITFHIHSSQPLVHMGSNAVGYWLPSKKGLSSIESFTYDFSDILKTFTYPAPGQVREYEDGKWTGKMIDGMVQTPVSHTIEIDENGNASITFDMRQMKFTAGQLIDFDPIAQTGSVTNYNIDGGDSGSVSETIAVPSDAQIVIVGISGYGNGPTADIFSGGAMTFTKGGEDTTMTTAKTGVNSGDHSTAAFQAAMFYLVSPDAGGAADKKLKWDWVGSGGTFVNPPLISVIYFKGINTSTPVRGAGGGQNSSNTPYTTSSITALSGDLIVAWVGGWVGSEGTINSWSNLSLITQVPNYVNSDGAWASGSPSGNTTVAASSDTDFNDGGIVAIALEPAAAASAPTVTTQDPTDITATTVTGNGNVTSDGGSAITERGTVWSTSANPTTSDNKFTASGTTGAFTTSMTGFSEGQTYHVRAFATNAIGTSYGDDIDFIAQNPSYAQINSPLSGRFLDDSLVGYWSFDGADTTWTSATEGTANDLSGNNKTGTLTNMSRSSSPVPGISGQGLYFDGTNDYVETNSEVNFSTGVTYAFWMKGLPGSFGTTVGKVYVFCLAGYAGNTITCVADGNSSGSVTSNVDVLDGTWHHVVFASASGAQTIYIDGNNAGSATETLNTDNGILQVGHRLSSSAYYAGQIDDVRVYNRVLATGEIAEQYQAGAARLEINTTASAPANLSSGLVGHWTFDGANTAWTSAATGTAADLSSNNNAGTLTNMSRSASPVSGKIGQGLKFDGVDDEIDMGSPASLDNIQTSGSGMTIGMWVKISSNTSNPLLIGKGDINGNGFWLLRLDGSDPYPELRFTRDFGTVGYGQDLNVRTDFYNLNYLNNWKHIVMTWDGTVSASGVKFYIDGASRANTTNDSGTASAVSDAANNLVMGTDGSGPMLNGVVDEVRIYNRPLSPTEVSQLYNLGARRTQVASPGVCSYATKDSSTGTSDTEAACGGGNDGEGEGYRFTTTSAYDVSQLSISLKKVGSPVCSAISAKVYTDNGGVPGTLLGTSATTFTCASIATSQTNYDFNFSTPVPLSSGTLYWVTVESTGITTCNYLNSVGGQSTASGGGVGARYAMLLNGSWVVIDNGWKFTFAAKSCN